LSHEREEGRGKREEGRGKREEGRGKREEGRGKREEGRSSILTMLPTLATYSFDLVSLYHHVRT
jgi:hypothetical protein